jgi:hypothetical protein
MLSVVEHEIATVVAVLKLRVGAGYEKENESQAYITHSKPLSKGGI